MPETPVALSYASRPSSRRRWIRRALLFGCVACIAIAATRWGPGVSRQAILLYWQQQCLRYAPPPDLVVYQQDATDTPALASAGGAYEALNLHEYGSPRRTTVAVHVPRCEAKYLASMPNGRLPGTKYMTAIPPLLNGRGAVLFMHERQTPSGARYLLIVRSGFAYGADPRFIIAYDLQAKIVSPATWNTLPSDDLGIRNLSVRVDTHAAPPDIKIFAGQADPADASHFTIRYVMDGKPHVVDGFLRDQGKGFAMVKFKVR
ncbi:MAG TPA: hypothetical protein VFC78_03135 [Tepidisphaeraceae bacterium]|nr:hypothetical protein [Tepidisphaeraceae bacterium]